MDRKPCSWILALLLLCVVGSSLFTGTLLAAPSPTHQDAAFFAELSGQADLPGPISSHLAKPWKVEPEPLPLSFQSCLNTSCRTDDDCVNACPPRASAACCAGGPCGQAGFCFFQ